jgi:hypothetical protein
MAEQTRYRRRRTVTPNPTGTPVELDLRTAAAALARRRPGAHRPRLAIAYDVTSSSPLELVSALGGRYDLVWVAEAADPSLGSWARLLPRLGRLIDVAGRSVDGLVDDLVAADVDGVISFTDDQLELASRLASALGLEGNPPDVVRALVDKVVQRRALDRAGLPGPRFVVLEPDDSDDRVVHEMAGLDGPVVVKPARGSGSRHTARVDGAPGVLAHIRGAGDAGRHGWIVEEWLGDPVPPADASFADYVSVEAVAGRGTIVPLAVTGKFPLAEPCRETGNFLPHHLDPDAADAVQDVAVRAAEALGVRTGALHIEVKLARSGPRVIEVNGRVGGGGIEALFASAYGCSLTGLAAAAAVGRPADSVRAHPLRPGGFTFAYFVQAPAGACRLAGLDGLDRLAALDGVTATTVNRTVGDELDWRQGSQGYLVSVRGTARDLGELGGVPERVHDALEVTY